MGITYGFSIVFNNGKEQFYGERKRKSEAKKALTNWLAILENAVSGYIFENIEDGRTLETITKQI